MTDTQNITLLTDFTPEQTKGWALATDRVMGGLSEGRAGITAIEDGFAARMFGRVSTANNGGFIQIRTRFEPGMMAGYRGIYLRVLGSDHRYAVHLRNSESRRPWMNYRHPFSTSGEWEEIYLDFADFQPSRSAMPERLTAETVFSLGIVAYGDDFDADLLIDKVGIYR